LKHLKFKFGSCENVVFVGDGDDQDLIWQKDENFLKDLAAEKMLGEGGFGKVFLYQHEKTGKHVAIKFINDFEDLGNDIARLMVLSSSPECSRYVVCYESHAIVSNPTAKSPETVYAIKMAYVDGPTLDDVEIPTMKKNIMIHELLANALKSLNYVHSKNIVHHLAWC
jgi:serine/threonine protein kinase